MLTIDKIAQLGRLAATRAHQWEKAAGYPSLYQRRYPKHNWKQYSDMSSVTAPYEGWKGAWKSLKGLYAPGQLGGERDAAVQQYLLNKNKQYPLPKGVQPWANKDYGERNLMGPIQSFEPPATGNK